MEQLDADVPLPDGKKLTVCIVYNLQSGIKHNVEDTEAEYDSIDTVNSIKTVFEKNGYNTVLLGEDKDFSEKVAELKPDFVFNIAEGIGGRARESEVPVILDMLGIPYSGSDGTTLGIALDKSLTKKLMSAYKIKTPGYCVAKSGEKFKAEKLKFPLIIKPNAEGSSKGVLAKSVVTDRNELKSLLKTDFERYGEDMLVEEYIEGREFTVALLGNGDNVKVFEPMEIVFKHPTQDNFSVYSYNVKKEYKKHIEYKCPSDISVDIRDKMKENSKVIFKALGCRDFGRIDYRVSGSGEVYFIEINPLPGLAPEYSDFPMITGFCGISYEDTVMSVLKNGLSRCGILK